MDDYAAAARRAGLEVRGVCGLTPPLHEGAAAPPTPRFINRDDIAAEASAVADIRRFRPDVNAADLRTSWVQIALTSA